MSNNRVAMLMKTCSEERNRKMADIRWWLPTLKGILKSACGGIGCDASGKVPPTVYHDIYLDKGTSHTYEVKVTMFANDEPCLLVMDNRLPLDPAENWGHRQIDFIHDNFDAVIYALEKFCFEVGRDKHYDLLMSRFGK